MKDVSLDDLIAEDKQKQRTQTKNKTFNNKNKRPAHHANNRGNNFEGSRFERNSFQNKRSFNQDNGKKWERDNGDFRNNQEQFHKTKKIFHDRQERTQPPQNKEKAIKEQAPKFEKGRTLKVLGLHPDITNDDLYKLFSAEGALDKCMIEQDNFGRNLPSAIVQYHVAENAKNATANINGRKVLNSVLTVEPYKNVRT